MYINIILFLEISCSSCKYVAWRNSQLNFCMKCSIQHRIPSQAKTFKTCGSWIKDSLSISSLIARSSLERDRPRWLPGPFNADVKWQLMFKKYDMLRNPELRAFAEKCWKRDIFCKTLMCNDVTELLIDAYFQRETF